MSLEAGPDLRVLPPALQESTLLGDVIYALSGVEGKYLKLQNQSFYLDANVDISLRELVPRIFPLADAYVRIRAFVDQRMEPSFGVVNHALGAALREFLKEYLIFVNGLDEQHRADLLSLQKLWYYVQPSLRLMGALDRLVTDVDKAGARGGDLLNLLHRRAATSSGDRAVHGILARLMERASQPYLRMLEEWIYRGRVHDPYGEFLVRENAAITKEVLRHDIHDRYWEERYRLRMHDGALEGVPVFLRPHAEAILNTGKYLNVIRECGRDVAFPEATPLPFAETERAYAAPLERAHRFASQSLLDLLLKDFDLVPRLRSIKNYFLFAEGDFFVHFMDLAEAELEKPAQIVSTQRLESVLDIALRTCATTDPYRDDVGCELDPFSILDGLQFINQALDPQRARSQASHNSPASRHFTLTYRVQWPLSLVLTHRELKKYQLLFRHVFLCKLVERKLCHTYTAQEWRRGVQSRTLARLHALRHRMLHFVQALMYHATVEVLDPCWRTLETELRKVTTVDQVLRSHHEFLETCLLRCLLTDPSVVKCLTRLFLECILFYDFFTRLPAKEGIDASAAQIDEMVHQSDQKFSEYLTELLVKLQRESRKENPHLASLQVRLDFSAFYLPSTPVPAPP